MLIINQFFVDWYKEILVGVGHLEVVGFDCFCDFVFVSLWVPLHMPTLDEVNILEVVHDARTKVVVTLADE